MSGLLGLGALLALAPAVPPRLGELLFGDPLSAGPADLAVAAGLLVLGAAALAALHRPLEVVAFDRDAAGSLGIGVGRVQGALLVLLAIALIVAVEGLGNLLSLAVLVAPPVAVRRHAGSPAAVMIAGGGVAVVASVAGLYASYHLEIAAGAAIALALCVAAAIGAVLPSRPRASAT